MLDKIVETVEYDSCASSLINQKLNDGWIIIDTFQYEAEGESHGTVLLGRLEK